MNKSKDLCYDDKSSLINKKDLNKIDKVCTKCGKGFTVYIPYENTVWCDECLDTLFTPNEVVNEIK